MMVCNFIWCLQYTHHLPPAWTKLTGNFLPHCEHILTYSGFIPVQFYDYLQGFLKCSTIQHLSIKWWRNVLELFTNTWIAQCSFVTSFCQSTTSFVVLGRWWHQLRRHFIAVPGLHRWRGGKNRALHRLNSNPSSMMLGKFPVLSEPWCHHL